MLVDPERKADLAALLEQHGWYVAVPPTSAQILTLHSSTYRHPTRPCEIDLHDRFPGFLADPQQVFEVFWARRVDPTFAGREIPCCDVLAHATIAALHALRDPDLERNQADLDYLVEALGRQLDDHGRTELAQLAQETGSAETLQPVLSRLGVAVAGERSAAPADLVAWRTRTASTGVKTVPWLAELARTPLRQLPGRLVHAFLLTEAEIRDAQPQAAPGRWGLFRARLRRLAWGLRDLPRAVSIVRAARRTDGAR